MNIAVCPVPVIGHDFRLVKINQMKTKIIIDEYIVGVQICVVNASLMHAFDQATQLTPFVLR